MARVKYYINNQEPDAVSIADALREAGIDFDGIPTAFIGDPCCRQRIFGNATGELV